MFANWDPSNSICMIGERLLALNYTVEELVLRGMLYYKFVSPNGRCWTVLAHKIGYPFPSLVTSKLTSNKALTNDLAIQVKLPIPDSVVLSKNDSTIPARQLLEKYAAVVVKPLDSTLSRGVTLNVTSIDSLRQALDKAYSVSEIVLVQEQVVGEEIRFPVIGGKVRAALLRRTPRVVGDGHHTTSELIKTENEKRAALRFPYLTYPQLSETIIDNKYLTDGTVLQNSQILELGKGTMIKTGASVYNVIDDIHPSYIEEVERFGRVFGYGFVAIDMFINEFTEQKRPGNYWFIEANNAPVLKLFYSCRDGKMFDVLHFLVPMIDSAIRGQSY